MKVKSAVSAKTFFQEMLSGLCIDIDSTEYFWWRDNRFQKKQLYEKGVTSNIKLMNLVEF